MCFKNSVFDYVCYFFVMKENVIIRKKWKLIKEMKNIIFFFAFWVYEYI